MSLALDSTDLSIKRPPPRFEVPALAAKVPEPIGDLRHLAALYVGRVAKLRVTRSYVGKGPGHIAPGVSSCDSRLIKVVRDLVRIAEEDDPPRINDQGFADSRGFTNNLRALLSRTGIPMSAVNVPPPDQLIVLPDLALGFKTAAHEWLFKTVHGEMFGHRVRGTPFSFASKSSTSQPFFAYEPENKQYWLRKSLADSEGILRASAKDDRKWLYNNHNWADSMHIVFRDQPEDPEKERKVWGVTTQQGKLIWKETVADKGSIAKALGLPTSDAIQGQRRRTAYGYNWHATSWVSCWLVGNRQHYLNTYAFTWKHTTPEQIYGKIKDAAYVVGSDIKQMDQSVPFFLLDKHADYFEQYVDPRFASVLRRMNTATYFCPQPGLGLAPFSAGSFLDPKVKVRVGLASGRPDNPDIGKWVCFSAYLAIIDDLFGLFRNEPDPVRRLDLLRAFMRGEHPLLAMLNAGDDNVIIVKRGPQADRLVKELRAAFAKGDASPYFRIVPEIGISFLGNVIRMDEQGQVMMPIPSPVSFLVNWISPEHDIWSPHRREFWPWGVEARLLHYAAGGEVISDWLRTLLSVWQFHFKNEVANPVALAARARQIMDPPGLASMDPVSRQVFINPDKLFYQYTDMDVAEDVRKLFTTQIPGDVIERALGHFMH